VLPNIKIGDNVIIGAGSVVTKNIPSGYVAFGNPARVHCATKEYLEKNKRLMKTNPVYDSSYTIDYGITSKIKKQMVLELTDKIGYVE
jgi:maltose O-acetyltransferase